MSEPWSTEKIAAQFRDEVYRIFAAENQHHREEEAVDLARAQTEHADYLAVHPETDLTIRDSLCWEVYQRSTFHIEYNHVKIILPNGFGLYSDLIEMFRGTSVGWTRPSVSAETVDNEPRVVIDLLLVDTWDDDRAAQFAQNLAPTTLVFLRDSLKRVTELRQALTTWWLKTLVLRPYAQSADPDCIRPAPLTLAEHTLWTCDSVERRLVELPGNLSGDHLQSRLRDISRNIGYIEDALWQLGVLSLRSAGRFSEVQPEIPESLKMAESQLGPREGDIVDENGRVVGGIWPGGRKDK